MDGIVYLMRRRTRTFMTELVTVCVPDAPLIHLSGGKSVAKFGDTGAIVVSVCVPRRAPS